MITNSTFKALVDQYKKETPDEQTKIREVLQQIALLGLERHGFFERSAFYGGTALRILFGLDRFSEDMDFTLLKPDANFQFTPYLEGMCQELRSFGLEVELSQKAKPIETAISSAFLKTNTLKLYLSLGEEGKARQVNHNAKIHIKLEVDTDPPLHFRVENRLLVQPVSFHVLTLHPSDLFAGKMHAVLYRAWQKRVKGRDWYDLIWYIQNKIPLSLAHLNERVRHTDPSLTAPLNRETLLQKLNDKISQIDWTHAKEDVKPFILDLKVLDIWSANFFSQLLGYLITE